MITATEMYWILKLDDIRAFFGLSLIPLAIFLMATGIAWAAEQKLEAKKYFFRTVVIVVLFGFFAAILPSTKQMAMIKVIPMLANSEIVGEMSSDAKELYRMGINAIKEQLTGKEQGK